MLIRFFNWVLRRHINKKLRTGESLTSMELIVASNDTVLRDNISELGVVNIDLPDNIIIGGVKNLMFSGNVRIHSKRHMAITTAGILSFNPHALKHQVVLNGNEIEGHVKDMISNCKPHIERIEKKERSKDACNCSSGRPVQRSQRMSSKTKRPRKSRHLH